MACWILRTGKFRLVLAGLSLALGSFFDLPCPGAAEIPESDPSAETFSIPGSRLYWTRSSNPSKGELSWQEAQNFVRQKNKDRFANGTNWRLPSRDELTAMVKYLNSGGSQAEGVSAMPDFYWSATSGAFETDYADAVNMADGSVDSQNKSDYNYLWPVCPRK